MMNRRYLITGLISLVAAPAIVRAGSLMQVKAMDLQYPPFRTKGAPLMAPGDVHHDLTNGISYVRKINGDWKILMPPGVYRKTSLGYTERSPLPLDDNDGCSNHCSSVSIASYGPPARKTPDGRFILSSEPYGV